MPLWPVSTPPPNVGTLEAQRLRLPLGWLRVQLCTLLGPKWKWNGAAWGTKSSSVALRTKPPPSPHSSPVVGNRKGAWSLTSRTSMERVPVAVRGGVPERERESQKGSSRPAWGSLSASWKGTSRRGMGGQGGGLSIAASFHSCRPFANGLPKDDPQPSSGPMAMSAVPLQKVQASPSRSFWSMPA